MANRYALSVIVPTRGRRESVHRLLKSLAEQTLPAAEFEVIVVVNGVRDGTEEMVQTFPSAFQVRALWHEPPGRAAACNAGSRAAAGSILLFLDDDMEPGRVLLERHRAAHAGGTNRGVVGAAPIATDASSLPVVRFRSEGFQYKLERLAARASPLRFNDVYTGNFSVRCSTFLRAGGFDEHFQAYGHEDYELALRLQGAGIELYFCAAAEARQHYTKEFRDFARDIIAEGETAVLLAAKHPAVLAELPLARWRTRSRKARIRLGVLLAATRCWSGFTDLVIRYVEIRERRTSPENPDLYRLYRHVLDYCYWLGSSRALRERGASLRLLRALDAPTRLAGLPTIN